MGVPVFCILLGFPVGWYCTRRAMLETDRASAVLGAALARGMLTSGFTSAMMLAIWGRMIPMLFSPATDFEKLGIPLILCDPKLSFVGWIVLMSVISPFLQLLTTVFAACLTLLKRTAARDRIP